jgi:hypothetical protein
MLAFSGTFGVLLRGVFNRAAVVDDQLARAVDALRGGFDALQLCAQVLERADDLL